MTKIEYHAIDYSKEFDGFTVGGTAPDPNGGSDPWAVVLIYDSKTYAHGTALQPKYSLQVGEITVDGTQIRLTNVNSLVMVDNDSVFGTFNDERAGLSSGMIMFRGGGFKLGGGWQILVVDPTKFMNKYPLEGNLFYENLMHSGWKVNSGDVNRNEHLSYIAKNNEKWVSGIWSDRDKKNAYIFTFNWKSNDGYTKTYVIHNIREQTNIPPNVDWCVKNPVITTPRSLKSFAHYGSPYTEIAGPHILLWVGVESDEINDDGCGGWTHTNEIEWPNGADPVSETFIIP